MSAVRVGKEPKLRRDREIIIVHLIGIVRRTVKADSEAS
jgi:hypothetical protein